MPIKKEREISPKGSYRQPPRTYLVCRVCSKDGRAAGYRTSPSGSTPILRLHDFTCFSTPRPRPPHRSTLVLLRSGAAALPHLCTKVRQNLQLYSSTPSLCACREWGSGPINPRFCHRTGTPSAQSWSIASAVWLGRSAVEQTGDYSYTLQLLPFSNLGTDACSLVCFYV